MDRWKPWLHAYIKLVIHLKLTPVQPDGNVFISILFQENLRSVERRFDATACGHLIELEIPEEILYKKTAPSNGKERKNVPSTSFGNHLDGGKEADEAHPPRFELNDEVCVVSQPNQRGLARKVLLDYGGTWNYEVYISAEHRPIFKESDLKLYVAATRWGS